MGLYIQATGEKYDSKLFSWIFIGVIGFVVLATCQSMGDGEGREIAIVDDRHEISSWETLNVDEPTEPVYIEPEPVFKTDLSLPDRLAYLDWEYPDIQGWTHVYSQSGYTSGHSSRLRATFARFEGQIRFEESRRHIGRFERRVLGWYDTKRRNRSDYEPGRARINFYDIGTISGRWVSGNVSYKSDIDDEYKTPYETWRDGGDCEDIAIMHYWLMMRMGVPERRLRILVVDGKSWSDRTDNTVHAMLAFYGGNKWFVIDNGAYFSEGRVQNANTLADVKVLYSFNRMGFWRHKEPALNAVDIITPDIKAMCAEVAYRLEHGLASEPECYGYVATLYHGSTPRRTELWTTYGTTEKHFPLGNPGVLTSVYWKDPKDVKARVPLTIKARAPAGDSFTLNDGFPRWVSSDEIDGLISLAIHKAVDVASEDPELAEAIMLRAQRLEISNTHWHSEYKIYRPDELTRDVAAELQAYLEIPSRSERYDRHVHRYSEPQDREQLASLAQPAAIETSEHIVLAQAEPTAQYTALFDSIEEIAARDGISASEVLNSASRSSQ